MTTDGGAAGAVPLVEPDVEVWNRSTTGVPFSALPGDVAVSHVLRFDGYAAAGSVLEAVEMEIGEGWTGEGRAGFAWLGMGDVVALLDDVVRQYDALNASDLEGEAHGVRYDEIDAEGSERYAGVAGAERITSALRRALTERPEAFAPTTGFAVAPLTSAPGDDGPSADPVEQLLRDVDRGEHATFALDISADEKARRSVQALTAFGLTAAVEGGLVVLGPWDEAEDDLLDAVFALLDLRYPEPEP